ncbi:MAG: MerR family transcriptional regulator [Brevundimonas sp.]
MADPEDVDASSVDEQAVARFEQADAPALAVAVVARRLGVAPATLRTWDRRYGLGPSAHSAGSHRRYSPADVERLLVMRRLTLDGVAPVDAARVARSSDGVASSTVVGAPSIATPTMLVDAVLVDDRAGCARLLVIEPSGDVAAWWLELVSPALDDLARRTVIDRPGVDATRALEAAALEALRAWAPGVSPRSAPVVLVVPSGRDRPLLAHALAAALAAEGVDARIVGGPVGPRQGAELVVMTRPRAVVTVAPFPDPDLALVSRLADVHPEVPQFVMVPESSGVDVPVARSVHRARTFRGLLHEVLAVAAP